MFWIKRHVFLAKEFRPQLFLRIFHSTNKTSPITRVLSCVWDKYVSTYLFQTQLRKPDKVPKKAHFFKYINFNHMSGFLCVWNVTRFNYLFVFIIFFFCHQIKDVSLTGIKRTPNQIQDGGLFRRRGGREGLQVLRQARQTRLQTSPQRTRHGGWKRNYVSILVIYFALCSSSWLLFFGSLWLEGLYISSCIFSKDICTNTSRTYTGVTWGISFI